MYFQPFGVLQVQETGRDRKEAIACDIAHECVTVRFRYFLFNVDHLQELANDLGKG